MRSLFARLAIIGTVGAALTGCGTSGSSLPVGAFPGASGGGPTQVVNQGPPGGIFPSALVDGGVLASGKYTGFTTAATDAQSALDAGADTASKGSAAPPVNPPGSHAITYAGNGSLTQSFVFSGTLPSLVPAAVTPGQVLPIPYGAIVFFSTFTAGVDASGAAVKAPVLSIELVGGSGTTQYDVRIGCANSGTPNATGFVRNVCVLPAYGASSGTYATKYTAPPTGSTAAGTFAGSSSGGGIVNPVITGAAGTFTPLTGPKFYIVTSGSFVPTSVTGNVLGIDYAYAEQGTN